MTTADTPAAELAPLFRTWFHAWAASRALEPPTEHGGHWRVEVGLPEQRRRHYFAGITDRLRAFGDATHEPWVLIKALATADELRAALPARWTVLTAPSYFMRFDGPAPEAPPMPRGYALSVENEAGVRHAVVRTADGTTAADGRLVIVDGTAVFDRIGTEAAHRRRGLGRHVMCALHAAAQREGVARGLLAATVDGHALYTTLGWRVRSPYATALIQGGG
jgi:GNAT superfamily N-acetyltransferase